MKNYFKIGFLFLTIFVVWLSFPYWSDLLPKANAPALAERADPIPPIFWTTDSPDGWNIGSYGDSFGALNTLFSGLAFAGLIVTIFLQSKELRETKEEITKQVGQMERQNFENTFFKLLDLHNKNIDQFSGEQTSITMRGGMKVDRKPTWTQESSATGLA